jgi:citrate lyase subunit beta/citryl-CoA lyase
MRSELPAGRSRVPRTAVPIRLERSVLAVPGTNPRMHARAAAAGADLVFLDLEDAVAPSEKEASRALVAQSLRTLAWGRTTRAFRINALDTPWWYRDLIEVVEAAGDALDCVIVPKVNRPEDVCAVAALLASIEQYRGFSRPIGIEAQVETAQGLVAVEAIAACSERLEALVFGMGDYAASMRMPLALIGVPDAHDALYGGDRFHYALHRLVAAARAHGLRVVDGPYAAIRDRDGFQRACRVALALGFDGKWCLHPDQVPVANAVFAPSAEELAWAQRVLAAYAAATAEGRGVLTVDGHMVDAASLRMAQSALERARLAGLLPSAEPAPASDEGR